MNWYECSQTPEWFREPTATPWAATPLHPFTPHHNEVDAQIERLYGEPFPDDVPAEFQELVYTDYLAGSAYRGTTNMAHFDEWLRTHVSHGPLAHEIIKRSEAIDIEPSMLLDFVCENDIQATELARLSVPYGYRLEHVPELRAEIDRVLVGRGATLLVDQPYGHIHTPLHRSDNFHHLRGILATYQKDIGRLQANDGAPIVVTERQSLAIRTDKDSGFPRSLHDKLANGRAEVSADAMAEIEEFIQNDSSEKFMVPLSMTVFAHREKPEIREQKARMAIARVHMATAALNHTTVTE